MDYWVVGWMDGWINGRTDSWMDGLDLWDSCGQRSQRQDTPQ